jgi:hypothetical protein
VARDRAGRDVPCGDAVTSRTVGIDIDRSDLRALLSALSKLERDAQDVVRDGALAISTDLAGELRDAARRSRTPAAALVALSIRPRRDRVVAVERVGREYRAVRHTPTGKRTTRRVRAAAGTLLWGSETGSQGGTDRQGRRYTDRFGAPHNPRGYWIRPTVEKYGPQARERWLRVVLEAIRKAGFEVTLT